MVAVEDIDFSGYFTCPESSAFRRYYEAGPRHRDEERRRSNIGPRLPGLLVAIRVSGRRGVGCPAGCHARRSQALNPLTMENIADTVLADRLATREEIDGIVREFTIRC